MNKYHQGEEKGNAYQKTENNLRKIIASIY